jgi:hypothetical protein
MSDNLLSDKFAIREGMAGRLGQAWNAAVN